MNENQAIQASKFLSLVLRHKPETIGLQLDEQGWADVDKLLQKLAAHHHPLTLDVLLELVRTNGKQRFAFNEDGTKIRASQGHSVNVELGLTPVEPPAFLYHGTIASALPAIREEGLKKMSRQHVHLSKDVATAQVVGKRRGKPIILKISGLEKFRDGMPFYLSANGVWLTDSVPARYIDFNAAQGSN